MDGGRLQAASPLAFKGLLRPEHLAAYLASKNVDVPALDLTVCK